MDCGQCHGRADKRSAFFISHEIQTVSIRDCDSYVLLLIFFCLLLSAEKRYAVKDVVAGLEYEFRVTALNLSGAGEFSNASEFVFARDPKSKWTKLNHYFDFKTEYCTLRK